MVEGDPVLVESKNQDWQLRSRFAFNDIAQYTVLFSRYAEVALGDRQ
jgi:hypothetical protein